MANMFEQVPLHDLADLNPSVLLDRDKEHPFVAMEDVAPCRRYVTPSSYRRLTGGARFSPGDTLFARITPCLENGKIAQFSPDLDRPGFGSTEFIVIRAKDDRADPAFIFYLSRTSWVRGPAERSMAGASGRQRAKVDAVANARVPAPPLRIQRVIGSFLSAYDDLVENNMGQIAIVEETARRIFEEWFVKFRAPGCEHLKIVNTNIGPIPKQWEVTRLEKIIEFDPKMRMVSSSAAPFVPMAALSTSSFVIGDIEASDGRSGSKFQNGDTLLARITPCLENGKTGYVDMLAEGQIGIGSTEFFVLRGRSIPSTFVQFLARTTRFRDHAIRSMSGASGRQRVRRDSLEQFEIAKPPNELLLHYHEIALPLFQQARLLSDQICNLCAQRDLLLPKLISGEIDVSRAERIMEAAE
jgi:type I restriction enzyme S subunit